jgi:hypothetical protein
MDRSSEGQGRTLTRVDHRDPRASMAAPAILIGHSLCSWERYSIGHRAP